MSSLSKVNNNNTKSHAVKEGWKRMDFRIKNRNEYCRYYRYSSCNNQMLQNSMFNSVIILYQYYKLVNLLIKKERIRMGQSLYAVLWFLHSRDEMTNNRELKDKEMKLGKDSKKEVEKG